MLFCEQESAQDREESRRTFVYARSTKHDLKCQSSMGIGEHMLRSVFHGVLWIFQSQHEIPRGMYSCEQGGEKERGRNLLSCSVDPLRLLPPGKIPPPSCTLICSAVSNIEENDGHSNTVVLCFASLVATKVHRLRLIPGMRADFGAAWLAQYQK